LNEKLKKSIGISVLVLLLPGLFGAWYFLHPAALWTSPPVNYIGNSNALNDTFIPIQHAQFYDVVTLKEHRLANNTNFIYSLQALATGWNVSCWVNCTDGVTYQSVTHNLVTNNGITYVQQQILGQASTTPKALYIAVTTDSASPAYTDTACTSEINTNGLSRALGTLTIGAPAAGASTNTIINTFTASGSFTAVQKGCLWTATSGGTLFADTTFSSTNMASGDTLAITWKITITY
jgi:hypothetical protein